MNEDNHIMKSGLSLQSLSTRKLCPKSLETGDVDIANYIAD